MNKIMNKNKDLSYTLKGYENKWVALTPDYERVVSSGEKLNDALSKIRESERSKVVLFKVIPPSYAPSIL